MTDHGRLLRNAFSETRITLPDSGAQIVVMLADAEYMPDFNGLYYSCLLYKSPSPRDRTRTRMPSSACKKKKNTTHNLTTHAS